MITKAVVGIYSKMLGLDQIQENPDLNVTIGKQVKVLIFSTKESKLDMFEKCLLEIQSKN